MKKKLLALLLCLNFMLTACGEKPLFDDKEPTPPAPTGGGAVLLSEYALAEAALPQLPSEPNYADLDAAYEKLDYEKMGAEAYESAQQALWDEWDTNYRAYSAAVRELRGEGVNESMTEALRAYSIATIPALLAGEDNTIYSPANLYLALSMLTETVDGESRAQLLSLLGTADTAETNKTANAIWRNLYQDGATSQCKLANSLWLRDDTTYNTETVERLANDYFASTYAVPMGEKDTNDAIAAWLNANTGNLLQEAAGDVKTNPDTVMALLSTLYFYDRWSDEFYAGVTKEDIFTAANGDEQKVDFMHKTEDWGSVIDGEGYLMAELCFRSGATMRFLLPDEGVELSDLLGDAETLDSLLREVNGREDTLSAKLIWSVPKFDVDSNLDLIDALKALGVEDIFDGDVADFSPLADFPYPVEVTQVKHAARVKIDEEGCEAAAFTAIMADCTSALPAELEEIEMNLNRPFAFLITGVDGLPLFVGAVNTMK